MPKSISSKLPSEDVFSTYCTTSASAHKYMQALRTAQSMPNENGFTRNRHHQWNTKQYNQWQTSYEAAHTAENVKHSETASAAGLFSQTVKERSAYSKQNYTDYGQATTYAGCQSESKSAYTVEPYQPEAVRQDLAIGRFRDECCSDNGYTRNSAVDLGERDAKIDHCHHQSECQTAYDWPIANPAQDLGGWKAAKITDGLSGYSKSCTAWQPARYDQDLNTTIRTSYPAPQTERRRSDFGNYVRYDGMGTSLSGYISNTPSDPRSSATVAPAGRHGKGLVSQRYSYEGNIPLYTIPIVHDPEPKRDLVENDADCKGLTPSPQTITMRSLPPTMIADLSAKRTHWKAY